MDQLVPYIRNVDGSIVRIAEGIYQSSSKELDPCVFEESLSDGLNPRFIGQSHPDHAWRAPQ